MLKNIYDDTLKSDDIRVGRNHTKGIFMKIFLILLTFAVNILLSGYNNQQIYATTVVEKNNIEEQENTLYSGNRITSDYLEVSGGVNFWCENINGENHLKLEYIPQEDEFADCKVECENGRVQSNIITKYSKVNYYLNADNQIEDEYADRITINYYDEEGTLLSWSEKYIYWDPIQETYYSSDIGI